MLRSASSVDVEQQSGGQVVEVPADLAEHWQRRGWATAVESKPAAKRKADSK